MLGDNLSISIECSEWVVGSPALRGPRFNTPHGNQLSRRYLQSAVIVL
jgi:hypothetical protein